jgi:serine protease Do
MNVADQIKEDGVVRRGWLGVLIQEVNRDLALSFGLEKPMGALIAQASSSGPAGKAGIEPGDIIVRFNGKDVERSSDLPPMVGLVRPGTTVPVDVVRQGDRLTLDVTIEQLPEANQVAQAMSSQPQSLLGMAVDDVPESLKAENNLRGGLLVKEVTDDPALSAGLRAGDIITQVGGREISDVDDLQDMLDSLPTDRPIPVLVVRGGNSTFLTLRLGR